MAFLKSIFTKKKKKTVESGENSANPELAPVEPSANNVAEETAQISDSDSEAKKEIQQETQFSDGGHLRVNIIRARDLKGDSESVTSSLVVSVVQGDEHVEGKRRKVFTTDTIPKTTNPTFNHNTFVDIHSKHLEKLEICVMNWRDKKSSKLGTALLPVKSLEDYRITELVMQFDTKGSVELKCTFYPATQFGTLFKQCVEKRQLFEDSTFPHEENAIGTSQFHSRFKLAGWHRLANYCLSHRLTPQLFKKYVEPANIRQQSIDVCYLLSAMALVASNQYLIKRIFEPSYTSPVGLYLVKFFWQGTWKEIIIDDWVPFQKTQAMTSLSARSVELSELWVTLLEKAYAKLHGTYEAIEKAHTVGEALEHLTGGFTEIIELRTIEQPKLLNQLFDNIMQLVNHGSLLGCSIESEEQLDVSCMLLDKSGIAPYHLHTILDAQYAKNKTVRLLKVRNTWACDNWTGDWSNNDTNNWTTRMRKILNYYGSEDGCFWMTIDDFVQQFNYLYLCRVGAEKPFETSLDGEWIENYAGGNIQQELSFFSNPQYQLYIPPEQSATSAHVLVTIEQLDNQSSNEDSPSMSHHSVYNNPAFLPTCPCGVYVFRNEAHAKRLIKHPTSGEGELVAASSFKKMYRDAVDLIISKQNNPYIVIPCMFHPKITGNFRIKVSSDACPVNLRLIPKSEDWCEVQLCGAFDTQAMNGSHFQLSSFLTNPCYLIENIQSETSFFIKVNVDSPLIPFYPYVLKAVGIEKAQQHTQIKLPDCALFPPKSTYYQGEYNFTCILRPKDAPFLLVLSTLYGDTDSRFTITCRSANPFIITSKKF